MATLPGLIARILSTGNEAGIGREDGMVFLDFAQGTGKFNPCISRGTVIEGTEGTQ
jgi:hypothetical protein